MNSEHAQSALCLLANTHWLELIGYAHYVYFLIHLWRAYCKARGC